MTLETLAREIMTAHTAALASSRTALDHARHAGDLLCQAKAQVAHGEWLPWLAANCDLMPRMAQVYMQISRQWPAIEEQLNAYPDTHFGISDARTLLTKDGEDDAAHGDVDGDVDVDADDDDDAADSLKALPLLLTAASLARLREHCKALAEYFELPPASEAEQLCAVLAMAHAALIQEDGWDEHNPPDGFRLDARRGTGTPQGAIPLQAAL